MDAIHTPANPPTAALPTASAPAAATPRHLRLTQAYASPAPVAVEQPCPRSPDTVTLGTIRPAAPRMPEKARALVAATVAAPAWPEASPAAPASAESLPFYRHPADRNLAATAISAGRALDVRG